MTLAHVIASPDKDLYGKLGLIDAEGAIGIMTITTSEGAMIAADKMCIRDRSTGWRIFFMLPIWSSSWRTGKCSRQMTHGRSGHF